MNFHLLLIRLFIPLHSKMIYIKIFTNQFKSFTTIIFYNIIFFYNFKKFYCIHNYLHIVDIYYSITFITERNKSLPCISRGSQPP